MDVGEWLQKLGLREYEAAFRDNQIDAEILPKLTAEDLKDLGVTLVGHRRRLIDAIAVLVGNAPAQSPVEATRPAPNAISTDGGVLTSAERRQLTVLFCDLVGSTALSARLDPEDMREIIGAYHRCCAEQIERAGGFVAKYMGDGVLAYFGYPRANEHDAEHAAQAGLALIAAVPKLDTLAGGPLRVRIGIATGLVVVGDLIGAGAAQEQAVVGETPNLAARLQAVAEPDTVVIADDTRRLLGNLFELKDLGSKDLKGIAEPAQAWAVLRARQVESRFDALHSSGVAALVGREEEFDLLVRRWSRVKAGEGQVVLLSGEAGIGKSRLTAALLERLAIEPHTRLRYFCSPQHTDRALHPFIGQMERAAGLAYDDDPLAKLDKLDAVLAQTSTVPEDVALIVDLLSLTNDGRYPALETSPEQRRQKVLEALFSQLSRLVRQNPVLMIFEDAHWVDPTSLELLGRMVDRIRALPVLLVVTFRPEFGAPWVGQSHVTNLTLNRLGEGAAVALIARLVGNKVLSADVMAEIVERTDGIPLFVEEMTKAVLEAESEGAALRTATAVPSAAISVPATLHASLMARLDRLGPAKELAQIGSAIGREFPHALLAAVARQTEAELESALTRLVKAGLLFRQGVPPQATYLFKHALVQDAAYGTLLRERRRALHARITETLESHFAETTENQPELLARHCTEAGLIEKAAGLWGKAGQRSLDRSALAEAAAQLTRALDQIATLPATPALRREQIRFQVAIITPLLHIKGYAAPETKAASERARWLMEQAEQLGESPEDPLLLLSVLYSFWVANLVAFNGDAICDLAVQFLELAEKQKAVAPLMIGHRIMGTSLVHTSDLAQAREHLDRALALYDPTEHRHLATRFGQDIGVASYIFRSMALWMLGFPEAALRSADDAMKSAREIGQISTLMYALGCVAVPYILCRNVAVAATLADELIDAAEQQGSPFWRALGAMSQGSVMALTGRASDATTILTTAIAEYRTTGARFWVPLYLAHLAFAHAALGQFEEAWRCIDEATTAVESSKETWCEAEIQRTAGEIALMSPERDGAKAQAHFERAIAIAQQQKAKSWELRATTSLARLWRDQNKHEQARGLLAPVYGWFTEGFDTADLRTARAFLDELGAPVAVPAS